MFWSVRAIPSLTRSAVGAAVTSVPPSEIAPASAGSAPEISRSAVVFPEPFGPISAVVSPRRSSSEKLSTATTPP